jgi:hypothetical protein
MDCRAFRRNHVAFVDDVLSIAEMRAMDQHRATCAACSRQDTMVRRSLLLIRNLPPIEPSPDFMARLNQRLDQLGPAARVDVVRRPQYYSPAALTAVAAGLIAVAYMAVETTQYFSPAPTAHVAPMIASVPAALEPAPTIANSAFVASIPTGMPVWPAMMMAGQAPMHFASLDFHDGELER